MQTFRFWQEGPGYDRNIDNGKTLEAVLEYIHLNPVRRKLCESASAWPWSSAWYYQDESPPHDGLPQIDGIPLGFLD